MGKLLLKAVGGPFTENFFDEFEALTGRAILDVDLIEYDEEKEEVVIPLTRLPVVPGQRKVFRKVTQYKQVRQLATPSVVTIRNVKSLNMTTRFEEDEDRKVDLLFGIVIRGKEILVTSRQEDRGKHLLELKMEIDSLDIEIRDV